MGGARGDGEVYVSMVTVNCTNEIINFDNNSAYSSFLFCILF